MRTTSLVFVCSVSLLFCINGAGQNEKKGETTALIRQDTIDFKTQVQPIFQRKCTPCHFPGGKMYVRMPFDKGETIIAFQEKIVKRIKDEQELALIKQFISENK